MRRSGGKIRTADFTEVVHTHPAGSAELEWEAGLPGRIRRGYTIESLDLGADR